MSCILAITLSPLPSSVLPLLLLPTHQVKTSDLKETWEDSPDRLLLEMGGVTTKRPTEQQQE